MILAGLSCFVCGLITLIRGYIHKTNKIKRGWYLSIVGLIIFSIFIVIFIASSKQLSEEGDGFLTGSFIFVMLFYPFAFAVGLFGFLFFLITGVNSLKQGYERDNNGKRDIESIVLGYIMLTLLIVVTFSQIMFFRAMLITIGESIKKAYNSSSARQNIETVVCHKVIKKPIGSALI